MRPSTTSTHARRNAGPLTLTLSLLATLVPAVPALSSDDPPSGPPRPGIVTTRPPPVTSALRYDTEYPLIGYADRPKHNAVARLQERLDRGEVKLKFTPGRGYLDSVLKALGIDPSSQTLVYSKTSLQFDLIRAATPRAIYFDDDTYVAWIPETRIIEVTTMDSALGPVFYTMQNQESGAAAQFDRETLRCLTCHDTFSMMGGGVPRFLFMSSPVTVNGEPLTATISKDTTDATPISERWGGWYVTGKPDGLAHLGNIQVRGPVPTTQVAADLSQLKVKRPGTLANLDAVFNTKPYLTDHSDIVALLIFEHQVYVENIITRASYKARTMVARTTDGQSADALSWDELPAKARPMVKAMLEPLVKALLLVDAGGLPGKITGNSGFDRWFQSQGPRDTQGRSLRELDLTTRVFRYPLSYMIYSVGFEGLPTYAKDYVYRRLAEILGGHDQSAPYTRLPPADRAAALEILTATKPAFASFVQTASLAQNAPLSTPLNSIAARELSSPRGSGTGSSGRRRRHLNG
jgi:hypothetical protein